MLRQGRATAFDWRIFAAAGLLSTLSAPLTAMWFLLLAPLTLLASVAVATARRRSLDEGERALGIGWSAASGLLLGPALYLALALAS